MRTSNDRHASNHTTGPARQARRLCAQRTAHCYNSCYTPGWQRKPPWVNAEINTRRILRLKVSFTKNTGDSPEAPDDNLLNIEAALPAVHQPQNKSQHDLELLNEQRALREMETMVSREATVKKDAAQRFNLRAATKKAAELNTKLRKNFPSSPLRMALAEGVSARFDIIALFHDAPWAGHRGVQYTYQTLRRRFYWPQMRQDVETFVGSCPTCSMNRKNRQQPQGEMQSLQIP